MPCTEKPNLALVELILDGVAMNEAALEGDWDEVRFRCQLIAMKTAAVGHVGPGLAAVVVLDHLGPAGSAPRTGFSEAMNRLFGEIDALQQGGIV